MRIYDPKSYVPDIGREIFSSSELPPPLLIGKKISFFHERNAHFNSETNNKLFLLQLRINTINICLFILELEQVLYLKKLLHQKLEPKQ